MNRNVQRRFDFWGYFAAAAGAFLLSCVQTGFFVNLRIFGAAPDLCLSLVTAVALAFGAKKGAVCGFTAGLCLLSFSGGAVSLLLIFYLAVGILVGLYGEGQRPAFFSFLFIMLIVSATRNIVSFAELCLTVASFDLRDVIAFDILPNFAVSLLFSPISYLLTRLFVRSTAEEQR